MDHAKLSSATAITIAETDSKLFLGKSGEWWDAGLIVSLVFAAIAAGAVFVFTTGSINAHKREADDAERQVEALKKASAEMEKGTAALKADAEASRARISEANAKAAEAQLALEKIRLPRRLDASQIARIRSVAIEFPGTRFTMGVFNDQESIGLSAQIDSALAESGWIEEEWKSGGDIVLSRPGRPSFGFVTVTGVYVQADRDKGIDFATIVQRLSKAIAGSELTVRPQVGQMPPGANNDAVKILVGQKEL